MFVIISKMQDIELIGNEEMILGSFRFVRFVYD